MAHFTFKAKRSSGDTYSGERDAADRFELYRLIREGGDEIISLQENKSFGWLSFLSHLSSSFSSIKIIEKIHFARNLGSMLEAGLSLARALSVLEKQTRNHKMKVVLGGIIADVTGGMTFADSLTKYPKVFPQLFVSMVHAGEQSGTLSDSLKVVAIQMENMYILEKRVRGAMIYPSVIMFLMVAIAVLMFAFVVPTLMKTFTELNVQLPLTTRIVLYISNAVQNQGLFVLAVVIIIFSSVYYWSRRPSGKAFFHLLVLKMPIVGPLVQEVNAARTARTLSSLLGAGVDIVESVNITSAVVQNIYFRSILDKAAESIKAGEPMSKTFNEHTKFYPIFLAEMMNVGEETGKIKDMLLGVAKFYEEDVEQKTKDMSTVIEPVLMIVIGAAVGFFAVSMITPMYSLVNAI